MGCTPSKSAVISSQDKVYRDLDTCSTFLPSLKSSMSSPEKPRLCVETSDGRQSFLSVPCPDVHRRSVRQSTNWESRGSAGSPAPGSSCCPDQFSMTTCCPTPDQHGGAEGLLT